MVDQRETLRNMVNMYGMTRLKSRKTMRIKLLAKTYVRIVEGVYTLYWW